MSTHIPGYDAIGIGDYDVAIAECTASLGNLYVHLGNDAHVLKKYDLSFELYKQAAGMGGEA